MKQEDASEKAAPTEANENEARAWYAQIASISSSVMLIAVLVLGSVVAYVIGDMRGELTVISTKIRQDAPSLREKDLIIKELREENAQLKARMEQAQRETGRISGAVLPAPASGGTEKKSDKLSEAGSGLADCINAALNGKGSADAKCAHNGSSDLVIKSRG